MQRFRSWKGYAWVIVALSAFLLFYKYVIQVYPGLITDNIMATFKIDAAATGNLIAITFYSIVIVQLFSGILVDRYGYRLVSTISLLVSALGLLLFVQVNSLASAYAARILMGVGVACATVSYVKAVSEWFEPERFAFVNSFLATAAMLGAIAGQAPLAYMFQSIGWQSGLKVCAYIGVVGAILFWWLVRDKPKVNNEGVSSRFQFKDLLKVISKKENILLTLYSGLTFTPIDAFAGLWGNSYLRQLYNIDHVAAASLISMIFIGMAIGAPVIGKLSEIKNSRLPVMIGFHIASLLAISCVFYIPMPYWLLGCLLFVFGFCVSAFMLSFAVGRMINPIWVTASVAALINTGEPVMGGIFDATVGWFLDLQWVPGNYTLDGVKYFSTYSYKIAFLILPLSMLVALILLFFVKEKRYEN
jgi:MFS family permease